LTQGPIIRPPLIIKTGHLPIFNVTGPGRSVFTRGRNRFSRIACVVLVMKTISAIKCDRPGAGTFGTRGQPHFSIYSHDLLEPQSSSVQWLYFNGGQVSDHDWTSFINGSFNDLISCSSSVSVSGFQPRHRDKSAGFD